jgi:hypothetical protein
MNGRYKAKVPNVRGDAKHRMDEDGIAFASAPTLID